MTNTTNHPLNRTSVLMLAALFAGFLVPSLAHAQLSGLTVTTNSSTWTSVDKTVDVICPSGTVPIDAGFQLGGASRQGRIYLTEARPNGPRSIRVSATESAAFSTNWSLVAVAICAEQPAGYVTVSNTANSWSNPEASATAVCPSGKILLGTGMEIAGGANRVYPTAIVPTETDVTVEAREDMVGTQNLWSVTAHAFCADPISNHSVIAYRSPDSTDDQKFASLSCPSGTGLLGSGVQVDHDLGTGDVSLTRLNPYIYQGTHNVIVTADEKAGTMGWWNAWALHAYLICGGP